jgi:hypothetical protein
MIKHFITIMRYHFCALVAQFSNYNSLTECHIGIKSDVGWCVSELSDGQFD